MIKRKKRIIMYMAIIVIMTIGMGKIGEIALAENKDSVEEQNNDILVESDTESAFDEYFEFQFDENSRTVEITSFKKDVADEKGIKDIIIPSTVTYSGVDYTVTSIENDAFNGCRLTSIKLPSSLESIGSRAFSGCTSLESIEIPDKVKYIEDVTFYGCRGLTSIKLPDSVESIGYDAFSGCTSLESIALPSTLTSLDRNAFADGTTGPSGVKNLIFICQDTTNMELGESLLTDIDNLYGNINIYRMGIESFNQNPDSIRSYEFVGTSISLAAVYEVDDVIYKGKAGTDIYDGNEVKIDDYLDRFIKSDIKGEIISSDTGIENNRLEIGQNETSDNLGIKAVYKSKGINIQVPIHIVRAESISIKEQPTDTYHEGESYDPSKLVITLTYTDGKETDIAYSENKLDFSFEVNEEFTFETTEQVIRYKNDRLEVTHPLTVYGNRTLSGTNVQLTGKFNKSSQLNIGKVNEDSKIYEGLSDKKIIAEYDIDVTGGYDGDRFQIEFELENEINGKKVCIRHLKQDGNIEEFEETVNEGKTAIEVTELSPFVIYTEKEIVEDPETPIVPEPDEPNEPTPDIPDEPILETPIIKPNEPTPEIPIIGPNDLNKPIQTKPSQNQLLQNTVSTEDKQNILLWGVLGIMSIGIMSVKKKIRMKSQ